MLIWVVVVRPSEVEVFLFEVANVPLAENARAGQSSVKSFRYYGEIR